jgi:hypothetical protein
MSLYLAPLVANFSNAISVVTPVQDYTINYFLGMSSVFSSWHSMSRYVDIKRGRKMNLGSQVSILLSGVVDLSYLLAVGRVLLDSRKILTMVPIVNYFVSFLCYSMSHYYSFMAVCGSHFSSRFISYPSSSPPSSSYSTSSYDEKYCMWRVAAVSLSFINTSILQELL